MNVFPFFRWTIPLNYHDLEDLATSPLCHMIHEKPITEKYQLCVTLPFTYFWHSLLSGCTLCLALAYAPSPCIKEGCLIAVSVSLLALHILQYMPSDYSSTQPSMKTAAVRRFRRTALGQWYYMTCWQEKLNAHERPRKSCIRKHSNPGGALFR